MYQIEWTLDKVRFVEEKAMLSEDECFVLEQRVRGVSITSIALALHRSNSTVHNLIKNIRIKYDRVQKEYPNQLDVRKL